MTNMLPFIAGQNLRFTYTNHRGETSERNVRPVVLRWGTSDYYPTPQWLLKALDHDRGAFREFALAKMEIGDFQYVENGVQSRLGAV
jgi:predicted DNA-binding transcriptional regulator YafY